MGKAKLQMYFGLELEAITTAPLCNDITVGEYHNGADLDEDGDWNVQTDSSVGYDDDDNPSWEYDVDEHGNIQRDSRIYHWIGTEYVSRPFMRNELGKLLEVLKKGLKQKDEFSYIDIDESCGAHIHFSIKDDDGYHTLNKQIPLPYLKEIRNTLFDRFKSSYPTRFERFKKGYYRDEYCNKIEDWGRWTGFSNCVYPDDTKYLEFYFSSRDGHIPEWRSFHLWCAKNWKDVHDMYELALSSMEDVMLRELSKDNPFEDTLPGLDNDRAVDAVPSRFERSCVGLKDYRESAYRRKVTKPMIVDSRIWDEVLQEYSRG